MLFLLLLYHILTLTLIQLKLFITKSSPQVIQMYCLFLFCHFLHKQHHRHPVPMPTASLRWFRCTGMEATEMCHHWGSRRKEEFCKWRDAQRKRQVGRRAVYKEELASPQSPGSLTLAGASLPILRLKDWKEPDSISPISGNTFGSRCLD